MICSFWLETGGGYAHATNVRRAGGGSGGWSAGDLLACGDKFLVAGRGTRYQRPKNARAASVLIYADPASAVAASLKKAKVESLLKLEGHRATKVQSLEELSAIVSSGRYDVILTANSDSANVQRLVQRRLTRPPCSASTTW